MMARLLSTWKKLPAKFRQWAIRAAIAFLVYTLLGFLVLPPILKWQLERRLPAITKRLAKVRQVRVNPWTLSLTIRGLELREPDGAKFASWEEFYANFQLSSLFRWAWTFKEIHLIEPYGGLILQTNGVFNFANLAASSEKPQTQPVKKTGGSVPQTCIFLLSITNGFVEFQDQTRSTLFHTVYRPINIRLTNLRTRRGAETPYSFKAVNDIGTSLAWTGDITVQPFSSQGSLDLRGADLKKYQPYLDSFARAQLTDGKADVHADYFLSSGTNGLDLIASNAVVQVNTLKIKDPVAAEEVFSLPSFTIDQAAFDLRKRTARVALLKIEGMDLVTRLEKNGAVNLMNLRLPPATNHLAGTNTTAPTGVPPPWVVALDQFQFLDATVSFQDLSRKTPFQTRLSPVSFTLDKFTTASEADAKFKFSIPTEANETLAGEGTLSINPVRSAGNINLGAVDLKKYWPVC